MNKPAPAPPPATDVRLLAALGLLSASVTAQQIALMQVLGWMHWHHFAYMIVAVALLGFGIAGTVLSLMRAMLVRHVPALFWWLLLTTAVTMPLGVRLAQTEMFAVDLPLVFFAPQQAWQLVALCLLLLPPFFCGGLATGLLLTVHARHAGRYYSASLTGAGLGGLVGLFLVAQLAPPRLPVAVAAIALVAVLSAWGQLTRTLRGAAVAGVVVLALLWVAPGELTASQFKPLQRALDLPDARIVASSPSVHGWIQIVAAPALRPSPAVSFDFIGEVPPHPAIFINGIPYGALLDAASARAAPWLDYTTDAAAFVSATRRRVLLLENGPGGWATLALSHGAETVEVIEPNRALINLLTTGAEPLAPEWRLPGVRVQHTRARAFLRQPGGNFDVIRFPSVGELGGTAGLGSASEQFLLTREAFADAWSRLSPDGVIVVTAWMDFPERNPPRLLATLAEMLERQGVRPREHLAALRGWATVTFLVRREPWPPAAVAALEAFAEERGFDPLLLPGVARESVAEFHAWQNPGFFDLIAALVDGPREPIYRSYSFQLRPATDRRPYFSQFLRWGNESTRLREVFGSRAIPFFELGSLVVALTFGVLTVLAVVCVVLPLVRLGWRAPGKPAVLLYFGGLGGGYMMVEIGLMLEAHAWLGSPVLAAALVLTTLLLASGIGSVTSERLLADERTQRRLLSIIAIVIIAVASALALLGPLAREWPLPAQMAILLCLVIAMGLPMGMAFPLGLRRVESALPAHVPWAWAINGCVSVAAPAGAMLLAMSAGFGALFAAAAVAYILALAGAWIGPRAAAENH